MHEIMCTHNSTHPFFVKVSIGTAFCGEKIGITATRVNSVTIGMEFRDDKIKLMFKCIGGTGTWVRFSVNAGCLCVGASGPVLMN